MKVAKYFKNIDLVQMLKIAVVIVVVIIAFRIALPFIKNILANLKPSSENQAINQIGNEIQTSKLSYPLSQYQTWAGRLFEAMDGAGTDTDTVLSIFDQMQNVNDVKQLIYSFGNRKSSIWFSGDAETLPQWLQNDLEADYINQINQSFISKNINYSF